MRYHFLMGLACLMYGPLAFAGEFFETLYDVPILLDLEEISEEAIAFDKPAGRIAHAGANSSYDKNAIFEAYQAALPQMGWKKISQSQYRRESEILSISIVKSDTSEETGVFVGFSLKPVEE